MNIYFDFEKPIEELENKIKLMELSNIEEPHKIKEFIKSNQKILEKLSIAHIRKMGLKLKN